jgi:hypothetical protein
MKVPGRKERSKVNVTDSGLNFTFLIMFLIKISEMIIFIYIYFNFIIYVLEKIEPITLEGKYIILRPPSIDDINGLSNAAKDGEIWNNRFSRFPNLNEIPKYVQEMLN